MLELFLGLCYYFFCFLKSKAFNVDKAVGVAGGISFLFNWVELKSIPLIAADPIALVVLSKVLILPSLP